MLENTNNTYLWYMHGPNNRVDQDDIHTLLKAVQNTLH